MATDVVGISGRQIMLALVGGTVDGAVLADLARGKLRTKLPRLERALTGQFQAHQRFLLAQQLGHLESLEELIEHLNAEVQEPLHPFDEAIDRLDTIPGVGRRTAEILVAEIGLDMTRSPPRHTSPLGLACALVTMRALGSARLARPAKETYGCVPR